jgi:hypothetical protein
MLLKPKATHTGCRAAGRVGHLLHYPLSAAGYQDSQPEGGAAARPGC